MSTTRGKLCAFILKENFGENIEQVCVDLLRSGRKSLRHICTRFPINRKTVRKSLCVLANYEIVSFSPSRNSDIAEYELNTDKILLFLRYPKYNYLIKRQYGNECEVLVEEILRRGNCTISELIVRAYKRLKKDIEGDQLDTALVMRLRDHFEVLVNKQYLQRCLEVKEEKPVPELVIDQQKTFAPLKIDTASLLSFVESNTFDCTDSVLWKVNFSRLHQDLRDDLLVTAISRRISQQAGDVLRLLLRQAYLVTAPNAVHSNSVPISQMRDYCRKIKHDTKLLDEYLTVISEDVSGFISRDDLSSVPSYVVNMQHAIEELTWTLLASAVEIRHGINAARIFRLIRQQIYIEQDEVQKKAMLPDKEGKLLTYTLVQGGWVQQHELKKGIQKAGPNKTFYLFGIDLNQVVRMYMEICYKSLLNCATRREYEQSQNSSLLDKHQRIQAITLQMTVKGSPEEDIAEISSLITPPETALVERIHATVNKLHQAELEIDDTLFILQLYLDLRGT